MICSGPISSYEIIDSAAVHFRKRARTSRMDVRAVDWRPVIFSRVRWSRMPFVLFLFGSCIMCSNSVIYARLRPRLAVPLICDVGFAVAELLSPKARVRQVGILQCISGRVLHPQFYSVPYCNTPVFRSKQLTHAQREGFLRRSV